LYFEWYRPTGLLLLPLVMLGFVASAVGQTNPNHLAREQSRYLSRAMNQPVDWYPWGADPFKRAKELHRPILLDVGAVWCPWCAFMDRDTYTNVDWILIQSTCLGHLRACLSGGPRFPRLRCVQFMNRNAELSEILQSLSGRCLTGRLTTPCATWHGNGEHGERAKRFPIPVHY